MDDLKQAYETLGLPEDATREEVEKRYFLLLKKARSKKIELDEINKAYKRIIGYESEKATSMEKQGKLSYFFYYYKIHLIVAVLVIVVAAVSIKGYIDRKNEEASKPPLDLSVTVYGNFYSPDGTDPKLSGLLLALVPEWKRIDVGVSFVPRELTTPQDIALQQKAMLVFMTEKLDLLILDEPNFEQLARQQAFAALDSLPIWPELEKRPERIRSAAIEDGGTRRPYGVDITDLDMWEGTSLDTPGERKILAMRTEPAHGEQAIRMMRLLALPE